MIYVIYIVFTAALCGVSYTAFNVWKLKTKTQRRCYVVMNKMAVENDVNLLDLLDQMEEQYDHVEVVCEVCKNTGLVDGFDHAGVPPLPCHCEHGRDKNVMRM